MHFKSLLYLIIPLAFLGLSLAMAGPIYAQAPAGQEYVVQADDWLSKIAEKEYGDPLAYPAIVEATNARAAEDSSFTQIDNPDVIEVGQKLWLPEEVSSLPSSEAAAGEAPTVAAPVGIYKAMLPAASSPGIDSTLYLNTDNTVRLVEDYLNGEPAITQVGSWQAAGERVEVTLTGQEGQVDETPTEVSFTLDGNRLATTPDEDVYGSAGRQYLRFEPLATGEILPPYDAAAAQQVMAESGLPGIYKGFSPAASCCGLDWTLFLSSDNSATLKSDYLNGEAPLVETGVWTATNDSLAVELAGAERPMTFQVAEGVLISNEFSIFGEAPLRLYRFEVIARNASETSGMTP